MSILFLVPFFLLSCIDWFTPKHKIPPKPKDTTIYSIKTISSLASDERYIVLHENRLHDDVELLEAFMDHSVNWWEGTSSSWSHVLPVDKMYLKPDDQLLKGTSQFMESEYEVGPYRAGLSSFQEELIGALKRNPFSPASKGENDEGFSGNEQLFTFWFGIQLFKNPEQGELFRQVDPEAIKQLKGIIPKATNSWQGLTYQDAYHSWFRHPARMMALSYAYILAKGIEEETQAYIYMAKREKTQGDRNALDYLAEKYDQVLEQEWHLYEDYYESGARCCSFRPYHAIGFWLRRHVDGSAQALWFALLDILKEYDSDWIKELQNQYPSLELSWDSPQQLIADKTVFSPQNRAYLKINNLEKGFETVVDGYKVAGFTDQLILSPEKHQLTLLHCVQEKDKGYCDCMNFAVNMEPQKQTIITYSPENMEKCSPAGKPIP